MATPRKKSTNVCIVDSDQIVQHIIPLKSAIVKLGTQDLTDKIDLKYAASPNLKKKLQEDSDSSDSNDEVVFKNAVSSVMQDEGTDVLFGKEIFQFRTPKKSGQMVTKAQDTSSPATPKTKSFQALKSNQSSSKSSGHKSPAPTPKSGKKKHSEAEKASPEKTSQAASKNCKRMESSTPYRLRKRNLTLDHAASSSDDSIDESTDDEEIDDPDENDTHNQGSSAKDSAVDINMTSAAETYFDLHSMAPITSDRTLAALDGPRLDVDTIREILKKVEIGHQKEKEKLMEKHTGWFKKWMYYMCCNYNILLHGLGSKRTLLEQFRNKYLTKFTHLVINGYFPSLTIKHVLNSITEEILGNVKCFANMFSQVAYIRETYKTLGEDFFLVIHNIDGVLLRSEKAQVILSLLSEVKGFHIIASVDHINAALMWDQNRYFRFRWLWYETPTYLPYEVENSYENSLMVQQGGRLALSSLLHVMRSLTPNARQIFLLLANYQMEEGDSSHYAGMSFQNLYHKCREAFLVNSDLTLQAQLVEFKDHRLIRSKKNFEGIEHLVIPLDRATLAAFVQDYKEDQ